MRRRRTVITKIQGWFVQMDMPDPVDNWGTMAVYIAIVAGIGVLFVAICFTLGIE